MTEARIVIVGGGAAGWLTAAHLARNMIRSAGASLSITLVEAPEIGTVGVGEGSFPTLRATLAGLGVGEADFMKASGATFKQGVFFKDWVRPGHDYFHPFNLPFDGGVGDLSAHWLARKAAGDTTAYADAVTVQQHVIAHGRGPKRPADPDFDGPMNYAYHFDAAGFAGFLQRTALSAGVRHVRGLVTAVRRSEDGRIEAVDVPGVGSIPGELFIDCSGFRAVLFQDLPSSWRSCSDVLFNDRALAVPVPHADEDALIAPFTRATARAAGWIWDIGLKARRGVGYVFSSRHLSEDEAAATLCDYIGPAAKALSPRLLRFETGYRELQWVGNCVAVGLAAGFFEPLESTGIMLIEAAARLIGETPALADPKVMAAAARRFNAAMVGRFERIVDFLKLHYCLSQRTDTAYWRDNADPATWPESLADRLAQWRWRPVSRLDFVVDLETFLPASWRYVLYGMGFQTAPSNVGPDTRGQGERVAAAFSRVAQAREDAVRNLPDHRRILEHYHAA